MSSPVPNQLASKLRCLGRKEPIANDPPDEMMTPSRCPGKFDFIFKLFEVRRETCFAFVRSRSAHFGDSTDVIRFKYLSIRKG